MITAHLVNHTHWDREWYFTTQDAQVLSDQLFTQVLDELESHPEANFTLDGQMSIIDDYIEIHPEAKARIRDLVNRKQLFIGPWYTQTDAMIPGTESLLRNLVIGIEDARKNFGEPMMLGYLPDTFGFNANLPMILNQVGIHDFLSWRGTNFKRQVGSVYFKWKALGNSVVFAANFPLGYYTGQIDLASKKHLKEFVEDRLDKGIAFEAENGDNSDVLIPSGIDQMNIVHDMSDTVKKLNRYSKYEIEIGTYPKFMRLLRKKHLKTFQGELRYPTYSRVHRTISSVRSRNKRKSFRLEEAITRRVEPLMLIAKKVGIQVSNGLLIKLWKQLFDSQPHDTLGGSVTDNVAVDIDHRFKQAFEIADGLENYIKKRLAQRLALGDQDVLLFNTDPTRFVGRKLIEVITPSKKIKFDPKYKAVIVAETYTPSRSHIMQLTPNGYQFKDEPGYYQLKISLNVEMPGLGYKVIHFDKSQTELPALKKQGGQEISNRNLRLKFENGRFDLSSNGHHYQNVIKIYDQANDGDTYDFSPLKDDHEIDLPWQGEICKSSEKGLETLVLKGAWQLPYDLEDRKDKHGKQKEIPYCLTLSLNEDSSVISGKLKIDNTILSHRLRLVLKTGITSEQAHAQIQGGFRDTKNLPIDDDWNNEFVEKPVNLYVFDKAVGIQNDERGLYFFGKGEKEYEKRADSLYITLMATTGQLGKSDLLWRPGRASGDTTSVGHMMMPTPMAQELGENTFEFGIAPFDHENLTDQNIANENHDWLNPSVSYQMQKYNLFVNRLDNKIWDIEFPNDLPKLKTEENWLSLNVPCQVSAIYPAYTIKDDEVLRLSNMSDHEISVVTLKELGYVQTNALEEVGEQSFVIGPYSLATFIKKIN